MVKESLNKGEEFSACFSQSFFSKLLGSFEEKKLWREETLKRRNFNFEEKKRRHEAGEEKSGHFHFSSAVAGDWGCTNQHLSTASGASSQPKMLRPRKQPRLSNNCLLWLATHARALSWLSRAEPFSLSLPSQLCKATMYCSVTVRKHSRTKELENHHSVDLSLKRPSTQLSLASSGQARKQATKLFRNIHSKFMIISRGDKRILLHVQRNE